MKNAFKFKQFEIDQTGCAMRINTDGVLLGAIATKKNASRILDIGTGTGVIALMLAQRFPDALVDAVEIDESAAVAAAKNAENAAFSERLNVIHTAIEDYTSTGLYDLIVSNPPFFVNDLKNPEYRKGVARHTDAVFFEVLLRKVGLLLSREGRFWFVLPVKQAESTIRIAADYGLFPVKVVHLHSDETKEEFRQIVCLGYSGAEIKHQKLCIYADRGVHTKAYKLLLKDFFLAF
ncbi:tRNA1(Val) (adenine(37)-N6)-methyltransferase [Pedobacter nyackensis]|uniref:tRNA1(Val) (adenine(37)-N6)-methyltransferase n=1 Tax=Pedobacter nyackensis TaxID=475255 RepID=UPI00292EB3E3|nr:methyltransferase [Pedobacter nyackensis]